MLKIRKNGDEKIVTSGAFKDLYEGLGYEIISEKKVVEKVAAPVKEVAPETIEKTEEKPTIKINLNKKSK